MKKLVGITLSAAIALSGATAFAQTMYNADGQTEEVADADVSAKENDGWYTEPVMYMYSADGKTEIIYQADWPNYENNGWYNEPVMYMYGAGDDTELIYKADWPNYENNGWYTEPVMNIYSAEGKTELIYKADWPNYENSGWYTEPVMTIYSANSRTEVIYKSDWPSYEKKGWYTEPVMYMYAPDGRVETIYKVDWPTWENVGWFNEPVMYVYAPDGRNELIHKSDLINWQNVGWYSTKSAAQAEKARQDALEAKKNTSHSQYIGQYHLAYDTENLRIGPYLEIDEVDVDKVYFAFDKVEDGKEADFQGKEATFTDLNEAVGYGSWNWSTDRAGTDGNVKYVFTFDAEDIIVKIYSTSSGKLMEDYKFDINTDKVSSFDFKNNTKN